MNDTISNELDVLEIAVPLASARRIVEVGCGAAKLARELLARHPQAEMVGLEVDERQHAKNVAAPSERLTFAQAGAQSIPFPDATFDGAIMLKSLHHVPLDLMDHALGEVARVVRPGGWFYVCEPVYGGDMNELVRLFNDEREVRAAAQAALDRAVATGRWRETRELRFRVPRRFRDFEDFERTVMRPTYADHALDAALIERVRKLYEPHQKVDGALILQPLQVRVFVRP